jgi:aspartate/methionine/tyrosine aminotransferase
MPAKLGDSIGRLMTNVNSCTASFTQIAGVEALHGDQSGAEAMVREFQTRRDMLVQQLNDIDGVHCALPGGAFYAFPNIAALDVDCGVFAQKLLDEFGVAALAGTAFGQHGDGFLRLSYANSQENLKEGVSRLADCVASFRS